MLKDIVTRRNNIQNIAFLALTVNLKKCKADFISFFSDSRKTLGKHPTYAYLSCSGNVHNCNVQFPLNEDKQICICYTYVSEVCLPHSLNVFNFFSWQLGWYQRHLIIIRVFWVFLLRATVSSFKTNYFDSRFKDHLGNSFLQAGSPIACTAMFLTQFNTILNIKFMFRKLFFFFLVNT